MPRNGSHISFPFTAALMMCGLLLAAGGVSGQQPVPRPASAVEAAAKAGPRADAIRRLASSPLFFEENRGQTDSRVKFLSRGRGYTLFLTEDEAVMALKRKSKVNGSQWTAASKNRGGDFVSPSAFHARTDEPAVLRMRLDGAKKDPKVEGIEQLPGKIYYVRGNETGPLQPNATYQRVKYSGVYPGIDVEYYGNESRLEFDFVVAPHADPKQIRLSFSGAEKIKLTKDGELALRVAGEEVRLKKPAIYQERNGERTDIAGGYVLTGKGKREAIFHLGPYDPSLPLIIDPAIDYATYLGTSGPEALTAVFLNTAGEVTVVGDTDNVASFPQTGTAAQGADGCFISKFDPTLSTLLSSETLFAPLRMSAPRVSTFSGLRFHRTFTYSAR